MLASEIPFKFNIPFAGAAAPGNITYPIPTPIQAGGRASLTQGFGPINFTPVAAGGIPPFGQDENGILYWLSVWLQWIQAGGPINYDNAFQAEIGGYPLGAFVQSATVPGLFYVSTIDNNLNVPASLIGWETLASIILNNPVLTGVAIAPNIPVNSANTEIANAFYADRSSANAQAAAIAAAEAYAAALQGNLQGVRTKTANYTVVPADFGCM